MAWGHGFLKAVALILAPVALAVALYNYDPGDFSPAPMPPEYSYGPDVSAPRHEARALERSERVGEGRLPGPEDLAYDAAGGWLFTGCADGWVRRPESERSRRGRRGLGPHRGTPAWRRARGGRRRHRGQRGHRAAEGEPRRECGAIDGRGRGRQVRADRRRGRRRRWHHLLHGRVVQVQPRQPRGGHPRDAAPRAAPELRPVHGADGCAPARPLLRQRRRRRAGPELPNLLRDGDEVVLEVPHHRRQERYGREVHRQPAGFPRQHPVRRGRPVLDCLGQGEDNSVGLADEVPVRPEVGVPRGEVRGDSSPAEELWSDECDAGWGAGVHVHRPEARPLHRLA